MKRLVLASVALIASAAIGPALAADIPVKMPVYHKAPPAPVWSWTGFYLGGGIGGRWAQNDWTTSNLFPSLATTFQPSTTGSMNSAAPRVAGYLGYNWQVSPAWVIGVEADFGWADNTNTTTPAPGTAGVFGGGCAGAGTTTPCTSLPTASVKETSDASVRGRFGTLVTPDVLLFGTAGVAWQEVEIAASCPGRTTPLSFCVAPHNESAASTMTGWTVGAGVEQRMWTNWLARIEYRYADFGTFSQQFFNNFGPGFDDRMTGNVRVRTHTLNLGLAYKF